MTHTLYVVYLTHTVMVMVILYQCPKNKRPHGFARSSSRKIYDSNQKPSIYITILTSRPAWASNRLLTYKREKDMASGRSQNRGQYCEIRRSTKIARTGTCADMPLWGGQMWSNVTNISKKMSWTGLFTSTVCFYKNTPACCGIAWESKTRLSQTNSMVTVVVTAVIMGSRSRSRC